MINYTSRLQQWLFFNFSCWCFLLLSHDVPAQHLPFKNYTVEDGLAGSVVNYVMQDSKGYIWLATETGVSRFDGLNFKNFTTQNGLTDNTVLKIYEDQHGRIWFFSFNGLPAYYTGEKTTLLDTGKKYLDASLTSMLEDRCGTIWLGTFSNGLIRIDDAPNTHQVQLEQFSQNEFHSITSILEDDSSLWIASDSGVFTMMRPCNPLRTSIHRINSKNDSVFIIRELNGNYLYYDEKEMALIKNSGKQINLSYKGDVKKLLARLKSSSHNLWIDTQPTGLGGFPATDSVKYMLFRHFKNQIPSSYLEDKERNIWLTTLLGGVYFLPYYAREFYTFSREEGLSDNNISAIAIDKKGIVWVGTGSGKLNWINHQDKVNILSPTPSEFLTDKINCMLFHPDGSLWCGTDGGIKIFRGKNLVKNISLRNINALSADSSGTVWAGSMNGLIKISKNKVSGISKELGYKEFKADALLAEKDSAVWVGNKEGLWKFNGTTIEQHTPLPILAGISIASIRKSSDGTLWIATTHNGIIGISSDTILHITVADGLCDNRCNSIFIDAANQIWVATNTGISKIIPGSTKKHRLIINNYTTRDGLASGEVNDIYKSGNTLWVATAKGLTYFDEGKVLTSKVAPPVYITGISINGQDSVIRPQYKLSYTQNNIRIDFIGVSYGIANSIPYKYLLEGVDTAWHYTQQHFVEFPLLPPNKYAFTVSAMNKDGYWSTAPVSIQFTITPPFWQTAWFKILTINLLLILLFIFYYYTSRFVEARERRKNELKRRILEAEQKALRAQMNPHFIFNALNSIQRFVVDNDSLSANEYLAKFGKLIRKILDNSKHASISIADELETLKLYLDLESLRFENKFEYAFRMDPSIDTANYHIPPMLIQPYVENAIWHGLMNKKSPGKLKILLERKNDAIIRCIILDNGIGRQKAMEMRNKHKTAHQSSGLQLTQERFDILNAQRNQQFGVHIIDLYDDDHEPTGTRVEITIPVDF